MAALQRTHRPTVAHQQEIIKNLEARSYGTPSPSTLPANPRLSSRKDNLEEDESDDFIPNWQGFEKKEEKSRSEMLGGRRPRPPKALLNKMAKEDSRNYSGSDREDSTLEELETMALDKSKDVTSDLRHVLKVAKDTEKIGAQTLKTLHGQGDQMARTHEKIVVMDQELSKGEKLLHDLSSYIPSFGFKNRSHINGPKNHPDPNGSNIPGSRGTRKDLVREDDEDDESLGTMDRVKKEIHKQDYLLDEVSDSLDGMLNMGRAMGQELDRQEHALDDLTEDVNTINSRLKKSNVKGRKILGK